MRVDNAAGGFAFTPSDLQFASGGVVALPGMAIERAVFPAPVPVPGGFDLVRQHLDRVGRPLTALCGFDLRIPAALPWGQFDGFNDGYLSQLATWGLLQDNGTSPLARTNVAPVMNALANPAIFAFSYTTQIANAEATFIVSGVAELLAPFRMPVDLVRAGETGRDALNEKAHKVIEVVYARLKDLGAAWDDSVSVRLYSAHDLTFAVKRRLMSEIGVTPAHGVIWHDATPPVAGLELEIDVRRYQRELTVWPAV